MKIKFHATKVSYTEAIDGEIVQVTYEEDENDDPHNPAKLYLHISASYEFGSPVPTAQWFDGSNEDGGAIIESFSVGKNLAQIQVKNSHNFNVTYDDNPSVTNKIRSFLARDCREINV
jgi:hypothetical protein